MNETPAPPSDQISNADWAQTPESVKADKDFVAFWFFRSNSVPFEIDLGVLFAGIVYLILRPIELRSTHR